MKNEISLSKFLTHYYELHDANILNMTHDDIKNLFPQIKRLSFDYAKKNKDSLASGKIIMVKDCKGDIIPYVCPKAIVKSETTIDTEIVSFPCSRKVKQTYEKLSKEELKDLTNWELIKLLRNYRKHLLSCYEIYREIKKKRNGCSKNRREKKKEGYL